MRIAMIKNPVDSRRILHGLKAVQDDVRRGTDCRQSNSGARLFTQGVILNPASAGEGSGIDETRVRVML
jgi:hypothetical protein